MKLEELMEGTIWIKYDGEEYKVPGPDHRDQSDYFTDDKEDAIGTAKAMHGDDIIIKFKRVSVVESVPSAGLSKKQKAAIVKKSRKGGDIGKKGKGFEKVVAAAKKAGAKDPEAVAGAAMWKNVKR